jgi:hypothetical protein
MRARAAKRLIFGQKTNLCIVLQGISGTIWTKNELVYGKVRAQARISSIFVQIRGFLLHKHTQVHFLSFHSDSVSTIQSAGRIGTRDLLYLQIASNPATPTSF